MSKPGITVVTPCYNQAEYLQEAIDSVLAQTFSDFELLLYDDGSTDSTWAIMMAAAQKDSRVRCVRLEKQDNVGPVLTRSIQDMAGDFWTWCPSDDTWYPQLLERKLAESKLYNHKAVLYNDWDVYDQDKGTKRTVRLPKRSAEEFAKLVWSKSPIGFTGIWIPKTVFGITGVYPTHLKYSEDFYWMVKAAGCDEIPFHGVQEVLVMKRIHSSRTTARFGHKLEAGMIRIWSDLRYHLAQKD